MLTEYADAIMDTISECRLEGVGEEMLLCDIDHFRGVLINHIAAILDWRKHTCGECGYWCGWCRRFENDHHANYEGFTACPDFVPRKTE